ncbi:hypothetical protein [Mycobacterium talmoniae]|uniref:Uncharacterized protein n=1 Tax=Mycobacterium talmoniae TaxID=1858794 RepID=A0A1S1NFY0_9MYCO|nr:MULTISPECIES: hypothetical protein [Mycobacterium]OHV00495.1 hypothetical protein BKN37_17900 [Mycobacterium talmoniae]TDH49628.1 hypothetical protein E2F47_20220 [Mycobacterium eburneum]
MAPGRIRKAKFGAAVTASRIISLAEVVQMPGFTDLSPEHMWEVANAPLNLQWLSREAHWHKRGRSAAYLAGLDPGWQAQQIELENRVRQQLRDIVAALAAVDAGAQRD